MVGLEKRDEVTTYGLEKPELLKLRTSCRTKCRTLNNELSQKAVSEDAHRQIWCVPSQQCSAGRATATATALATATATATATPTQISHVTRRPRLRRERRCSERSRLVTTTPILLD